MNTNPRLTRRAMLAGIGISGASLAVTLPAACARVGADPTIGAATPLKTISILGSGDIMAHPPTWYQAEQNAKAAGATGYDFKPMFRHLKDTISSADLAIAHLETPLGRPEQGPLDFPKFRTPPQMAEAIKWAGYDACSTASNHVLDMGEEGVGSTLSALDAAGLYHTGSYTSDVAARLPMIYEIKGVKVGHLSYAMHFNGIKPPSDKPWMANRIDPKVIAKRATEMRGAGAEIIVLSLHWGTEKQHEPDVDQLTWAREISETVDFDIILGHHTHCVQPFEQLADGRWIAFGMGNTLARHDFPIDSNREGAMARATFTQGPDGKWKVTKMEAIPIWLSLRPEVYIVNLSATLAQMSNVDDRRPLYENAVKRIEEVLGRRGGLERGLVVR